METKSKFTDVLIDDFFWARGHLWMKCSYTAAKCKHYGVCNFTIDPEDKYVDEILNLGHIEDALKGEK